MAQELLQTMGFRAFVPVVAACPGCGRTTSTVFQELARRIEDDLRAAMPVWREKYPGVEALKVAVMGCIVNGPGESKHADIGISLPGTGEQPAAPVFIDGKKAVTLRGPTLAEDFRKLVDDYVEKRFGSAGAAARERRLKAGRGQSRAELARPSPLPDIASRELAGGRTARPVAAVRPHRKEPICPGAPKATPRRASPRPRRGSAMRPRR